MKIKHLILSLFAMIALSAHSQEALKNEEIMNNPLLKSYNTPYASVPFDKIKPEHFVPALKIALKEREQEIDDIVKNTSSPTYENTIAPYERAGALLNKVLTPLYALNSAETSEQIQGILKEISPLISQSASDIKFNKELFKKVETVYNNRANENLKADELFYLEKTYKNWAKSGIGLPEDKQKELREISMELSKLALEFQENALKETNSFFLHFTDAKALDGFPQAELNAAASEAKNRNLDGYVITLKAPSYIAVMQYAKDRELRKKVSIAYRSIANHQNDNDNKKIAERIAELRQKNAKILGYKTHSDLVLEDRMAKSAQNVENLLQDLLTKARPAAENEIKKLAEFAKKTDGIKNLEAYDHNYYARLLKEQEFSINNEVLKQYFPLDNVIEGVFFVAKSLYGLNFTEVFNIPTYHKDVRTWVVTDENGNFKALFYGDYFPRQGKRAGAWMTEFRAQNKTYGDNQAPHIVNVCNFTPPTEDAPSLLNFNEVTTLFHEFGHALHGMLSDVNLESHSGTSVPRDFVELPSHIMENWAVEPEVLAKFAKHYKTGEVIPQELVKNVVKASNFMEGFNTLTQISYGLLDMAWHSDKFTKYISDKKRNIEKFERSSMSPATIYKPLDGTLMSCSFSHIFSGGYAAGYYSYKWSEVLEADAFELFKEKGILDRQTGKKFEKEILSKGGSGDVGEMYKAFRGREAKTDALLKRAGLI